MVRGQGLKGRGGSLGSQAPCITMAYRDFPSGTLLGVSIIRIIAFWVHIGVPLFRETTIWYKQPKRTSEWY